MPRTATKEAGKPATRTIPAKDPAKAQAARKGAAQTPKDWREEESNESEGKTIRGYQGGKAVTPEQCVANDNYSIGNWGLPSWQDENGNRLFVSFWFPTQNAAIDYPEDKSELDIKTRVFAAFKIPYVGVLPGQPLQVDEAQKQLIKQGARIS